MPVKVKTDNDTLIAAISGEIDHHTAPVLRDCIDSAIEMSRPKKLCLDFREVSFMDSSGVGLVMGRYKTAKAFGSKTEIRNLNPRLEKIIKLSGLEKILEIKN